MRAVLLPVYSPTTCYMRTTIAASLQIPIATFAIVITITSVCYVPWRKVTTTRAAYKLIDSANLAIRRPVNNRRVRAIQVTYAAMRHTYIIPQIRDLSN